MPPFLHLKKLHFKTRVNIVASKFIIMSLRLQSAFFALAVYPFVGVENKTILFLF